MSQDKITVDEPLISTDVDSLIRTLAERRKVALSELRQICRIDKKTIDKWVAVLEEEGYISVVYGLGGTYIHWKGAEEAPEQRFASPLTPPSEPAAPEPDLGDIGVSTEPAERAEASVAETAEDVVAEAAGENAPGNEPPEDFAVEMPLDEVEPEELLSQYLDRKKKAPSTGSERIKSSILSSLEEGEPAEAASAEEQSAITPIVPVTGGDEEDTGEPDEGDESEDDDSCDAGDAPNAGRGSGASERNEDGDDAGGIGDAGADAPRRVKDGLAVPRASAADMRDVMATYVQEINREKARLGDLKKEKDALYRDKFATMDGRMQADMALLMEKVLEKQTKLMELKERVLELPDKVDELGKLQEQMGALKAEGRGALLRTKEKASEYLAHIEEAKADVKEKVTEADAAIKEQNARLKELEKTHASLDSRASRIKATVDSVKSQLDELNNALESLNEGMQKVEQMKSDASGVTDAIKEIVAARGTELESLEQELEGVARVEHWVQEYIRDYEQKIEDVERYVSSSDEELAELKEASEALYMKKYLGELEKMADTYDDELHDAITQEKDIEDQVAESRSRITKLVGESQQMVKKLRSETTGARDYDSLVAKIKEKTAKARTIVEEKTGERAKLVDDSRKTRKTRSSSKAKLRAVPNKKKRK